MTLRVAIGENRSQCSKSLIDVYLSINQPLFISTTGTVAYFSQFPPNSCTSLSFYSKSVANSDSVYPSSTVYQSATVLKTDKHRAGKQNRSTEGCSKLKKSVDLNYHNVPFPLYLIIHEKYKKFSQ